MTHGNLLRSLTSILLAAMLSSCATESNVLTTQELAEGDSYKIAVGDSLQINVWRVPELTVTGKVTRDGTIGYPLLGDVLAEGKTAKEFQAILQDGLSNGYVENPVVTVTVIQGSWRYFITGEVKGPGSFKLEEDINVYQAIIKAGGFTDFASTRVHIIRFDKGRRSVIKVNVKRYLQPGEEIRNGRIMPGDTIVVKRSFF